MKIRALDIVAIALSLAAVAGFSIRAYGRKDGAAAVRIESAGSVWIYQLGQNRDIPIPGLKGITLIRIENGTARAVDSPCPDKLCVAMRAVSEPGQWIACLPNRVFVHVDGTPEVEVDGGAY